jgi:hypothetical protein
MKCFICDAELKQEMIMTTNDDIVLGLHSIVLKGLQIAICPLCFSKWNKILNLLLIRFKEQKHIDEDICKKILEYKEDV